jgi:Trypsin
MSPRRSGHLVVALSIALAVTATEMMPASAVSNGKPDGNRHPNVGCVLGQLPDESFVGCGTGQLIAPNVVMLAAHEFPVLEGFGATRFFVSFEPTVDPATSKLYEPADIELAPGFNPISFAGLDLAVILLSEPVAGVEPIELPSAGLLDQMARSRDLGDASLTVVGYGLDCTDTIPCPVLFDATRRLAQEAFGALQESTFSVLSNSQATGEGGPCFGDSGSPHFLSGTTTTIGVTKAIRGNCNTAVPVTRVDTPEARSFLGRFVPLP